MAILLNGTRGASSSYDIMLGKRKQEPEMSKPTAGTLEIPRGWVIWEKTRHLGFLLLVVTLFLCLGIYNGGEHGHSDIHGNVTEARGNQPTVTASGGFIAVSPQILDNGTVQVTSNSTVPADATIKTRDGRYLFTYSGLLPGECFYFQPKQPCVVSVAAD